jgi:hypothetical protein
LIYGQQPHSINHTRSVFDGIGNSAFVAIGKLAPVLAKDR